MFELAVTPILLTVAIIAAVPGFLVALTFILVWLLHILYERTDTASAARFERSSRSNGLAPALRSYFRLRTDGNAGDPARPKLYLLEPHGILAASAAAGILSWEDGPLLAVHHWFFVLPLLRAWMLRHGAVDTRESTLRALLRSDQSLAIYPDGTRGMGKPFLSSSSSSSFIYGIVRIAHELKIAIIPVHCGGEINVCWYWTGEWRCITLMRRLSYWMLGYPLPTIFLPRWHSPALCLKFGNPLDPTKYANAAELQAAYLSERATLL